MGVETGQITTDIPARLDRLPWSRWHWLVVIGLGTVWILDGLEVTIVGSMSEALKDPETGLGLSSSDIGLAGAVYVAGACLGALLFGQLTDRFGRKKLFLITLAVYTVATVLTAFSMNPTWYFACRFLTGAGIGGEYAAINSAIDELIPKKYRGRVDVAINGSFWVGAAGGALLTIPLLDPTLVDPAWGWRLAFGLGAILAVGILIVRRHVPESPRWLISKGRLDEARAIAARYLGGHLDVDRIAAERPTTPYRYRDFFGPKYRRRTAFGILFFNCQVIPYFAIYTFLPLLMVKVGLDGREFFAGAVLNVFLLVGGIAGCGGSRRCRVAGCSSGHSW